MTLTYPHQFKVQFFDTGGVPLTGLTPLIMVIQTDTNVVVVNWDSMTEIGNGWYKYDVQLETQFGYVYTADGGATALPRYKGGEIIRACHHAVLRTEIGFSQIIDIFSIRPTGPITLEVRVSDMSGNVQNFYDIGADIENTGGLGAIIQVWRGSKKIKEDLLFPFGITPYPGYMSLTFQTMILADLEILPGDAMVFVVSDIVVIIKNKNYRVNSPPMIVTMTEKHYAATGRVLVGSTASVIRTDIIAANNAFNGMQLALARENDPESDYMVSRNIISFTMDGSEGVFTLDSALPFAPNEATDQVYIPLVRESIGNKIDLLDPFKRLMGLTHENIYVANTFDIDGIHIGSQLQVYDSAANAILHDGSTGLIAKYDLTVTYVSTKPTEYVQTRV